MRRAIVPASSSDLACNVAVIEPSSPTAGTDVSAFFMSMKVRRSSPAGISSGLIRIRNFSSLKRPFVHTAGAGDECIHSLD